MIDKPVSDCFHELALSLQDFSGKVEVGRASAGVDKQPKLPLDDYPAAHSMDTTWFAVDADGFVGSFSTDESGVVPWRAARVEQVFEYADSPSNVFVVNSRDFKFYNDVHDVTDFIIRQILWAAPEQVLLNVSDQDRARHEDQHETISRTWQRFGLDEPYGEYLMFLPSEKLAEPYLEMGLARAKTLHDRTQHPDFKKRNWLTRKLNEPIWRSPVAVYFDEIDFQDCLKLHDAACLFCGQFDEFFESKLGVYRFECSFAETVSEMSVHDKGNYFRETHHHKPISPTHPLHVDYLPTGLRVLVEAVRFDKLRFRDSESVNVVEQQPCYERRDPRCFAFDSETRTLSCTSIRSEVNEQTEQMWKRAEEQADRWGYVYCDLDSPASLNAKRRLLRLRQYFNDVTRNTGFIESSEAYIRKIEDDIAESEKRIIDD